MIKKIWKAVKALLHMENVTDSTNALVHNERLGLRFGSNTNIPLWLRSIAIGYIAILYMPFTLEKIVIIVFAPIIYRWDL